MLREALFGLSRYVTEIVVQFPEKGNRFTLEVNGGQKRFALPSFGSVDELLPILQEVFEFVAENYHGEVEFQDMEYAAINGMLKSLDPHSSLLPPKMFSEFKTQTEGEFGGIGIVIGLKDGELTVIAPLPNTPAGRAGLKPNDKITKIGEEASINMDLTEAVERLRGKVGTKVGITLEREGAPAPIEVTLTRANIKIESVQSHLSKNPEGDVGIIKVKSFQEETLGELNRHLQAMKKESKNFKGLILDLRNNPGGLLNQAVDVADLFLKKGTIVLTVGAKNQVLEINKAHGNDADEDYPMIIIVNEGSASASEIVAGAIKKNDRGIVIGNQTFGKGSVQSVYALKDGSALKLTVAQYLTPGKASIQSVGITPDIKLIPMSVKQDRVDLVESETFREKDLEKHLESTLTQNNKPAYTLNFFSLSASEDEEENEMQSSYTQEINVKDDFQLHFAEQILLNSAEEGHRIVALGDTEPILLKNQQTENEKVSKALEGIGIDWSLTPVTQGKPKAAVTFNIQSSQGQALKAGEEVQLELKVHNVGDAPFHRLIAFTKSEHFLLKNREFIFGKINPGETKSWKVPLKVPAGSLSREDAVTFSFREGNDLIPEDFQTALQTVPLDRPNYAYRMEIHDDGAYGSKGDGDKKIEAGEGIILKLLVENRGPGTSQKTIVNLKNLQGQGIFVSHGRSKLETLAPGESKPAELGFTVGPSFAKDEVEMEITILDEESQELLQKKIKFPIGVAEGSFEGVLQASPDLTLDKQPYPTKTTQKKISIEGNIKDPSGLKDISVFVDDNKTYLKTFGEEANKSPVKEASFSAPISLAEKANNLITILARNQNDLITRQSFYIYQE
jgi:carboxyl-terminal processing protease